MVESASICQQCKIFLFTFCLVLVAIAGAIFFNVLKSVANVTSLSHAVEYQWSDFTKSMFLWSKYVQSHYS